MSAFKHDPSGGLPDSDLPETVASVVWFQSWSEFARSVRFPAQSRAEAINARDTHNFRGGDAHIILKSNWLSCFFGRYA